MKANEYMKNALMTYEQRAAQYKDSYLQHGVVMTALFPNGIKLETEQDFNRFGVLNMQVSKLVRYTQSWSNPHVDSSHDLGVYSFIQEELDHMHQELKKQMIDRIKINQQEYESLQRKTPK